MTVNNNNNLNTKSKEELMEMVRVLTEIDSIRQDMIKSLTERNEYLTTQLSYREERCEALERILGGITSLANTYDKEVQDIYKKHMK